MKLQKNMTLKGFCSGYFGSDSYGDKIVLAFGENWIVARETDGSKRVLLATFSSQHFRDKFVAEWTTAR